MEELKSMNAIIIVACVDMVDLVDFLIIMRKIFCSKFVILILQNHHSTIIRKHFMLYIFTELLKFQCDRCISFDSIVSLH